MFVTKLRPLALRLLMVATMGLLAGEARAEYDSSGSATIGKTPLGADALKVTGEVS